MSSNLLRLNLSKTEFYLPKSRKFLTLQYNNSSSTTFTSDAPVRNLGVTLDPHLSFSNHISNLSRSCFMHTRDLRRILPMLDFKTASTIANTLYSIIILSHPFSTPGHFSSHVFQPSHINHCATSLE